MFGQRRATKVQAQKDGQPTGLAEDPPVDGRPAPEEESTGRDAFTLSTMCHCGHMRKDHRGMRMDICGACWECDCDEFGPVSGPLEKVRALLVRVERLQDSAARLRGQMNANGTRAHSAPPDGLYAADIGRGERDSYRRDARVLGEVGAVLLEAALPQVEVHLPRHLAEQAVAAWERDDGERPPDAENPEQTGRRHRAAPLALVGLSITQRGRWEGDEVVVELDPVFIGNAVDAAGDLPTTG